MEIQPARNTRMGKFRPEVVRVHSHIHSLALSFATLSYSFFPFPVHSRTCENLFLSAVQTTSGGLLASIGMIIRVLGQGESLGTRSCVSVGNEGRTSGFDVFEFRDREDVCGGKK